jgi:hypothetical protein
MRREKNFRALILREYTVVKSGLSNDVPVWHCPARSRLNFYGER